MPQEPRRLHSTAEIAEVCGVSERQVRRWVEAGHLPRGYAGPKTGYLCSDSELRRIEAWAETRPSPGRPPSLS